MADDNQPSAPPQPAAAPAPTMNLIGQYIRDLSFENPNAPNSILGASGPSPKFEVNINVAVRKQNEDVYAVELTITAKADREGSMMFNIELVYGGIFRIRNVPEPTLQQLIAIECPRLLFPFARQVLASVTQQGGFPPLMMEPVDFNALYRQNQAKQAAANPAPASKPN